MEKIIYWTRIIALMLVLFVDGMGQGIIFPILNNSLMAPQATLFFDVNHILVRHIWFGIIIGVYYFMWFISAPLLGDWSDNIGRKKPLLICLMLAVVGFLLSAVALEIGSITLLLFARLLGGVTSGDQAIAKAAIIDICPHEKKAIYLGLVLCAVTLGLVIGPLIGTYLQDQAIYSWFNIKVPLYFAAVISLLSIFLLQFLFKEKAKPKKAQQIIFSKSIYLIVDGFKSTSVRK